MSSPRSFHVTLQEQITPDQDSWDYFIPNIPSPHKTNQARLMKCVTIVSTNKKQQITLRYENAPSNRVTQEGALDQFLLLSLADFKLHWPAVSEDESPRPATGKENGDWITRLLLSGIKINNMAYHFFGHSNSQLKSRSCFMYAASKNEISRKIEAMGDLSKLKSVAKKAKRIGLLFSGAEITLILPPERCQDIDDVATKDYIFTDGCGLISFQLAKTLAQRRNIVFRDKRYLPSVFQIRYRGYKGVLTLDQTLKGQTQVQFRASMRKFKDSPDYSFAVVDYSKPYAFGNLNDEIVVLLHTLGITEATLLAKQAQYIGFLQNVSQGDCRAAFQFLSYRNELNLAERLLLDGLESVHGKLKNLVKQEFARMINKRDEQRCRIVIPKSRLLFGICDPTAKSGCQGQLKDGECFVRITQDGDGKARTIINTEVLVTRNPCLHPGDLQKFKTVDIPGFAHLVDCIVFSTRGKRPSADLMSGGDLDGDKFFVTWDSDIIPSKIAEPALYPGGKELITFGEVTGDSRAEYFARYTNTSLGKVKNLYMKWARLGNAMSPQCQQLNRLFSQCVDGNHIRIPENLRDFKDLEDPRDPAPSVAPFILDVLHDACMELVQKTNILVPSPNDDPDIMDLLLTRDKMAMSEFELLQIVVHWCDRHSKDVMDYSHHIDISALSDEQKIWFLSRLPPSIQAPSLIRNGLNQSDLITPQEFRCFGLDHPSLHWKPMFRSAQDRMGRFLPTVCRTLEVFHKKLIILNMDERLSMAVFIPQKIASASEVSVDSTVRVFVFPHSQGPNSTNYRVVPTKVNYRLYCDEHILQLYQERRGNTWIFLRAPKGDDSLYRAIPSQGDQRRAREVTMRKKLNFECKASVALDKISRQVQNHIGKVQAQGVLGAEIYVISNRDVASMNVLDQWLHYIDTEEVLPLFEKKELNYETPMLSKVNWAEQPDLVQLVCRDRNLSSLRHVQSITELQEILSLLKDHDENSRLREVFCEVLSLQANASLSLDGRSVASMMMAFLSGSGYLVSNFLTSQTWQTYKSTLEDDLVTLAPTIAKNLVLAANKLGEFVRQPLALLLREMRRMTLQNFAELVELIALTVRSSETALDLFLEVFEPETSRLLVGRPMAIRQFVSSLFGIALDHIDEAANSPRPENEFIRLSVEDYQDGYTILKSIIRVDSTIGGTLKTGDHIRLTCTNAPQNNPIGSLYSMDALVLRVETGVVIFRCLHDSPPYLAQCMWSIRCCGSFVTSKTAFDAVLVFYTEREACCSIYGLLLGLPRTGRNTTSSIEISTAHNSTLNASQNNALRAAMTHPLTLIWGPPGTGKTHTIIIILRELLVAFPTARLLVTAPTHNAVDNILRRFVGDKEALRIEGSPVRVSTQLSKVSQDLRRYTCDAMLGKDLSGNLSARRKAQKRIKEARLIFTTCTGASLGLLRNEQFGLVVIDEASQQTEPATLVPLVKGCSRAILVGDHVQLRATIQKHALLTGYDISLFERHYNLPEQKGVAKVMLDTQYRMHCSICDFSSTEFYNGRLKTAATDRSRILPSSRFPWPKNNRLVWIECDSTEDLGRQSKANQGQVDLCRKVVQLLRSPCSENPADSLTTQDTSIAILTPYTRQREALSMAMPDMEISSIDGFQGREADIIVFVTVRCNASCDIGFLADMRRLNVVMTRAKRGVVLIGNKITLTGCNGTNGESETCKNTWKSLIGRCEMVLICKDILPNR